MAIIDIYLRIGRGCIHYKTKAENLSCINKIMIHRCMTHDATSPPPVQSILVRSELPSTGSYCYGTTVSTVILDIKILPISHAMFV